MILVIGILVYYENSLPDKGSYRISKVHEMSSDTTKYMIELCNGFDWQKGVTWTTVLPTFNSQSEAVLYAESITKKYK